MNQPENGVALLVEDDPFMQSAVQEFLDSMGFAVEAATTYVQARAKLDMSGRLFRLMIVDISIPQDSEDDKAKRMPLGLQLVREAKNQLPDCGVVVWSAYTHFLPQVIELVTQGYRGLAYVPKGSRALTLRRAIDRVLAGDVYFHRAAVIGLPTDAEQSFLACLPSDVVQIVKQVERRSRDLSPRQRDVMEHFFMRPEVIANELHLELRTVRNYQDSLYDRLGLKDPLAGTQSYRRDVIIVLAVLLQRLRLAGDTDD